MKPKSMLWLLSVMLLIVLPILVACNTVPTTKTPPKVTTPLTTPPLTTTAPTTTKTTSPTTPASFRVEINGSAFIPATITVPLGATVTWVHRDRQEDLAWWWHSVTSETGLFASKWLYIGDTFSYTFAETGTYYYYDKNLAYMRGTVVVE